MTIALIRTPYEPILGLNALGLTGHLYIGVENEVPEDEPQACFWDAAGTLPAEQPIDVQGGYPMRDGTPAKIYTGGRFSIKAVTMAGVQVWLSSSEGPGSGAAYADRFYFHEEPTASEQIGKLPFALAVTFGEDFAGWVGTVIGIPSDDVVVTVKKSGTNVGTITVDDAGEFAFATSLDPSPALGDNLSFHAPADSLGMTGFSIQMLGVVA